MKHLQHTTNYRKLHKSFTVTNFDQKLTFNADDEIRVVTLCNESYASVTRLSDNQHAYVAFSKLYETSDSYDPNAEPEEEDSEFIKAARHVLIKTHFYDVMKRFEIESADEDRLRELLADISIDSRNLNTKH
jgi:hypothetical protein